VRAVALALLTAGGCFEPDCGVEFDRCASDDDCPDGAVCKPSFFGRSCLADAECSFTSECACGQTCTLREEAQEVDITRKTCEGSSGAACSVGASTGSSVCLAAGTECAFDSECCEGNCRGFVCQPPLECAVGGAPCDDDAACCSETCSAGSCTAAKCVVGLGPQSVAEDQHGVARLVADDDALYWIADGQLRRADKLGGQTTALAGGARASCLARAGARLFWQAADDSIWSVADGDPEPAAWSASPGPCRHMAASSSGVFWIAASDEATGAVLGASSAAPGEATPLAEGIAIGDASRIAADDARLFFSAGPALFAVPVGGGAATTLYEDAAARNAVGHSLAVDDTRVWFLAAPELRWAAKNGMGSLEVAESERLQGLAVDDAHVYWIDDRLYRMTKTGTDRVLLAGAPARQEMTAGDLLVDDSCVYWIEEERVRKAAK
jgi:hypothetical protein